jgi:hypothetical protein
MTETRNIDGHYYPAPHPGWGGFAEELFHYTSRYYKAAEAFLRHFAALDDFSMSGYKAAMLSPAQRRTMAAVLAFPPGQAAALAIIEIVNSARSGDEAVDAVIEQHFPSPVADHAAPDTVEVRTHYDSEGGDDVDPLDPFLSLAERLLMPVAVRDRHIEVSLLQLAGHLQSPNVTLRGNLHNAVVRLHNHGYVLRNHPRLTHGEAQSSDAGVADDDEPA